MNGSPMHNDTGHWFYDLININQDVSCPYGSLVAFLSAAFGKEGRSGYDDFYPVALKNSKFFVEFSRHLYSNIGC